MWLVPSVGNSAAVRSDGLDLHTVTCIEMRNTAQRENVKRHNEMCKAKSFI